MTQNDVPNDEQTPSKPGRSRAARLLPIVVVVVIVVLGAIFASRPTPGARTTTATSVRVIVSASPGDSSAQFPVALQEGGDPEHEADHIIEPLQSIGGVSEATLDWSSALVLTVEFDSDEVTAQDIANALAESGYLVQPAQ